MKHLPCVIISILCFSSFNSLIFAQLSGNITYTIHREANPTADQLDAYSRIKTAMDSASGYYNQYTTLTKHINVYYVPDVQTADASFNGTMRFGKNRSYMAVRTATHETAHTVGIGTTNEYRNLIKNGVFTGTLATALLREITGNPDTLLKGDNQHFWPYGLNYDHEVRSRQDLIDHCRIVDAMCKDMFKESFYRTCRLKSKSAGMYMTVSGSTLILGNGEDSLSLVKMIKLDGENVFRLEFGNKVLDIPNESRSAGAVAGVYNWNGGAHQRAVFEFESQTKMAARIKMSHSGLYLRPDGNRIIQDQGSVANENQYWELVEIKDPTPVKNHSRQVSGALKIEVRNNRVFFSRSLSGNQANMRITDLHGRIVRSEPVNTGHELILSNRGLSAGLYLVTFNINGQITSGCFMIK